MSPWLKVYDDLPRHPKTTRLIRLLKIDRPQAVGHLVCLWSWAFSYAESGDLNKFTNDDLADAAHWPGDAGEFVKALKDAGWLDGRAIHDWDEYAGPYMRERTRSRKRKQEYLQNKGEAEVPTRYPLDGTVAKIKRETEIEKEQELSAPASRALVAAKDAKNVAKLNHDDATFDRFWSVFPNRQGKRDARRHWSRYKPDEQEAAILAAEAVAYAVLNGYQDAKYVPMGSSWVNQERFRDWYDEDGEMVVPPNYAVAGNGKLTAEVNRLARLIHEVYSEEEA